jgi:phosphatidylethanolamine-binding protein (PEBP) family uncharacterized protein
MTNILHRAALAAFLFCAQALAVDRPTLPESKDAQPLKITFSDDDTWNGKRILKSQQCTRNGGIRPIKSPEIQVRNSPQQTRQFIVFFNNPRAYDNHGLFVFEGVPNDGGMSIPAIESGAGRGDRKLPQGITLFQGGSAWGAAYDAPCPRGSSWKYTVTVYALNAEGAVIAIGEADLGWSEL